MIFFLKAARHYVEFSPLEQSRCYIKFEQHILNIPCLMLLINIKNFTCIMPGHESAVKFKANFVCEQCEQMASWCVTQSFLDDIRRANLDMIEKLCANPTDHPMVRKRRHFNVSIVK